MTRISRNLVFHKRVFPLLWFGIVGMVGVVMVLGFGGHRVPLPVLFVPPVMAMVGYMIMRKLVWDLVDEVWDCGDALLVRQSGRETRVPLSNIMNINATIAVNPPRITVRLIEPGLLGQDFSFCPARRAGGFGFGPNPVAEDLVVRVHAARTEAARRGRG